MSWTPWSSSLTTPSLGFAGASGRGELPAGAPGAAAYPGLWHRGGVTDRVCQGAPTEARRQDQGVMQDAGASICGVGVLFKTGLESQRSYEMQGWQDGPGCFWWALYKF